MIKKYGIGMAAVLIAISAAAFTTNTHKPLGKNWFVLNSPSSNPANNSSYSLAPGGGADPGCPTQPSTVCAVFTAADASNSNIPDQTQLTAIQTASSNFTQQAAHLEYVRP
jgi:hypothetical protein